MMPVVEYVEENQIPTFYIWKRDINGVKTMEKDILFRPYFYVPENDAKMKSKVISVSTTPYKTIFGDDVRKVFTRMPQDVPDSKIFYKKDFEADIPFQIRYWIDNINESMQVNISYKYLYLDIENDDRNGVPNFNNPEQKIISITFYNSYDNSKTIFVLKNDKLDSLDKTILKDYKMVMFDDEVTLLREFIEYIIKEDFDIITGWYIAKYDMPYIVSRMKKLGVDYSKLSPVKRVYFNDDEVRIKGRIIMDLLPCFRHMYNKMLKSYSLDYVGNELVGEGKTHFLGGKIWETYTTNINMFVEYAVNDVEIMLKLNNKLDITGYYESLSDLGFPMQTVVELMNSHLVDILLLRYGKENNLILPTADKNRIEMTYQGAHVMDAPKGVFDNVAVFDVNRMYPSIITSFNLSPECLVKEVKDKCLDLGEVELSLVEQDESKPIETVKMKIIIDNSKVGIIPSVFKHLFVLRKKYQTEMKKYAYGSDEYKTFDMKQFNTKTITNAVYGVVALKSCRLYSPELAAMTTGMGRKIIKAIIDFVNTTKLKVIYADTDSCLTTGMTTMEDYNVENEKINLFINEHLKKLYPLFLGGINLEMAKIYKKILFYERKKKYFAFVDWDGKSGKTKNCGEEDCYYCKTYGVCSDIVEIKGFEAIRSNTPDFIEGFQFELLYKIMISGQKETDDFIYNFIKSLNAKDWSLEELSLPVSITKPLNDYKGHSPHVRGAKWSLKNLKIDFYPGDKLYQLWIKSYEGKNETFDKNLDKVICFKSGYWLELEKIKIDWKKLYQMVHTVSERLYDAIEWKYMPREPGSLLEYI